MTEQFTGIEVHFAPYERSVCVASVKFCMPNYVVMSLGVHPE